MGQVPAHLSYLLVGGGRLAQHLRFLLQESGTSYTQWTRKENSTAVLHQWAEQHSVILLAVSDAAIPNLVAELSVHQKSLVHFSGALEVEGAFGFHPLMTFSRNTYPLEIYQAIPYIGCVDEDIFRALFPYFRNKYYRIEPSEKALYHSLCTLAGNGTTLLWEKTIQMMEKMGLPRKALNPYLRQVVHNIVTEEDGRFTGPWYRQDNDTINKHKEVLQDHTLGTLYGDFTHLSQGEITQ